MEITRGLAETDGPGSYSWDTQGLAPGTYHVYGMVMDGDNPPVYAYAPGTVTIADSADLVASQSISPAPVHTSDAVTHTFTVTNDGPDTAHGVSATADFTGAVSIDPAASFSAAAVSPTFEDISATGTQMLVNQDDATDQIDIPFDFNFFGNDYSTIYASSNGLLTFESPVSDYTNTNLSSYPAVPTIAPFWDDLITGADGVYWEVRGTAGEQRLIVQWQNAAFLNGGSSTLTFEAVLFEGSNEIQFNYGNLTTGAAGPDEGGSATAGVKDAGSNRLILAYNDGPNAFVGSNKSTLLSQPAGTNWYEIPLDAGDEVVLETATPEGDLDPTLELRRPDDSIVTTDDNSSSDGRNARIDYTATETGVYRVGVGAAAATTGEFVLQVTRSFGDLANGEAKSFDVGETAPDAAGTLESNLLVRSDSYDPDFSNDVDDLITPVEAVSVDPPDLTVFVSQAGDPALGEDFAYELTVQNNGAGPASNVVLTHSFGNSIYVDSSASQGTTSFDFVNTITANLGTIAAGGAATVEVTLRPFAAGDLVCTSSVASDEEDAESLDNSLISRFEIAPTAPTPADLRVSLTASDLNPTVGDEITLHVEVTNDGSGIASGVVVSTLLPTGLMFLGATAEQGNYDPDTGLWNVGNLRDSLTRTLDIRTWVLSGQPATVTAEVEQVSEPDPDSTPGNGVPTEDDFGAVDIVPLSALRDVYGVDAGRKLTVFAGAGVLANDIKPKGCKLTAELVSDVSKGTLELRPNGSFTYIPGPGFDGVDSFTYKNRDDLGVESNVQTVTLATQIVSFRRSANSFNEAGKNNKLILDLRVAPTHPYDVPFTVLAKTAQGFGEDYTLADGIVTFAPGQRTQTISVVLTNDTTDEATEIFEVRLGTPPAGLVVGTRNSDIVSIRDNDPLPKVGFDTKSGSWDENASGSVAVSLSAPSQRTVTVQYAATGGTAKSPDDYVLTRGTLTFLPGETTKYITVPVIDDGIDEPDERIVIALSRPANASVSGGRFTYTILDDDAAPTVSFSTASVAFDENAGRVAITISLSAPSAFATSVKFSVTGGTATLGRDFGLAAGTVRFRPGETTKTIYLRVINDKTVEPDETVIISLASPVNLTLGNITDLTVTLQDDDA